jgi:hypothetical protein
MRKLLLLALVVASFMLVGVASASAQTLTVTPATIAPGGNVTVTWSGVTAPTTTDWFGLYVPGSSDLWSQGEVSPYDSSCNLAAPGSTALASGSCSVTIPTTTPIGTYEARLFANGTYTKLATSGTYTVTSGGGSPTISVSPASVAAGGTLTDTITGVSNPPANDWVGLYVPGSADTASLAWDYANSTFTVPAGTAAGTYEIRLFADPGYTKLATSGQFTVTGAADTTLPTVPAGLAATPGNTTVALTWTASNDNGGGDAIAGYHVYRNGVQVGTVTGTSFSDSGLTNGTSYAYTVSAYDAAGNQSAQSTAANATPTGGTGRWVPPKHLTWYWQLQGTPKVEPVMATDFDGFDNTAATVASFHALGQKAICYIDVGTWENWRSDASQFPAGLLGSNNGWPGERWLNISPAGPYYSTLQRLMDARFAMCAQKGFDAVEPDNSDGSENSTGFSISTAQNNAFVEWVAQDVHAHGMAVFQKNYVDQSTTLQPYFDGAIDEQCNQYSECSSLQPYLTAGKPVLNAEYTASLYPGFCTPDNAAGIMGALYSINLDGSTYKTCW